jgi:Nitrile hydratase, alpha chain
MTTRRDFLTAAVTAAGATTVLDPAQAEDHVHQDVPSDIALRVKSLESLLVEKGLVDRAALDALVDTYEHKVGPRNGARVVARAWVDPAYKDRLIANGTAAVGEFGYSGNQGADIRVVENTPTVHNIVVCTLCSCYPWPVLGLPPVWYKSAPYRARAVIDPRGSCGRWVPKSHRMSRYVSGIARRSSAIWFCQNGRKGPTIGARRNWPPLSRGIR